LVVIDSMIRLIPGALGNFESALTDSFQIPAGFDAPQYTRPAEYRGIRVPDVLLKGNHKQIQDWRNVAGVNKFKRIKHKKVNI
ncbi:MAG: hypothetical protein ACRDFC_08985, partial [Ignavibacteria bacterium]